MQPFFKEKHLVQFVQKWGVIFYIPFFYFPCIKIFDLLKLNTPKSRTNIRKIWEIPKLFVYE